MVRNHPVGQSIILGLWWEREAINIDVKDAVQFNSVTQSCPTLYDPMDCSTPGFPVHHQLLELIQTHVHQVGDAIQSSQPQSAPGLIFPDCIELLHLWLNIINLISVLTIWWCPCVELSLVLSEEGVCYDQCILLAKLLAFALLHSVLQGQICLLLQVSFDFLLLYSNPL